MDIAYQIVDFKEGIYYAKNPDESLTVGVNGSCPNLKLDSSCGIYESRPIACQNFELGGNECKSARKQIGRKPLEQVIPLEAITTPGSFSFRKLLGK